MKIVRWILSLALIFGIYTETGIWTALFAFLSLVQVEITVKLWARGRGGE